MPKNSLCLNEHNQYVIAADALMQRINRKLQGLIPYRELVYDRNRCGYLVRVISTDETHLTTTGPYYFVHMPALARMLNAIPDDGRTVIMFDRKGRRYEGVPALPSALTFDVLTPVLARAMQLLRGTGYTVTAPTPKQDAQPVHVPTGDGICFADHFREPVTAEVTAHEVTETELDLDCDADIDPARGVNHRQPAAGANRGAEAPPIGMENEDGTRPQQTDPGSPPSTAA